MSLTATKRLKAHRKLMSPWPFFTSKMWNWWCSCCCIMLMISNCGGNPDAKRLYDDLMSSYNRLIRPVGNNSDRLTVKMGLKLSQLIDVVRLKMYLVKG